LVLILKIGSKTKSIAFGGAMAMAAAFSDFRLFGRALVRALPQQNNKQASLARRRRPPTANPMQLN
jgi:hypothetical protein